MPIAETSREAYYQAVLSGETTRSQDRILRFVLHQAQAGVPITRHTIAHAFRPGGFDGLAFDGRKPIPLQSVCGRIATLIGNKADPDYVRVVGYGPDPITGNKAELLGPTGRMPRQMEMRL